MYLSKLEIFGFKSFANKTVINFTKGITGIVGPNGCGKTNIVDGIRWCLGEQKSSTLRSDKMENVIFNGTRNKKPMGMAEVSLTLVNDQGVLPTEYSEVTITRRIFRSGESEYLLNKNVCRLKDITNLFMDTGMGTNAYSVIELKMIETILSNKAEERRYMFEEAAGVNKYKLRRRLSLKKLDDVKSDLVRVNDIIAEVEKNVRSLSRQAKRADKYNQLQSALREKELDLAEREYANSTRSKIVLDEKHTSFAERKNLIDSEIRNLEMNLIEFRDKITEIESRLKSKRYEISKETEKLHNVQKNISVTEEREKALQRNIEKYREDLSELNDQLQETDQSIDIAKTDLDKIKVQIEEKKNDISSELSVIETKKNSFEEQREVLKSKNEEAIEIHKLINSQENNLNGLSKSVDKTNNEIVTLDSIIQKTTDNIAKTVGYLEDLSNERDAIRTKIEETETLYSKKIAEKEAFEKKLTSLKDKELEEKGVLTNLKNKIELLQTMITNLEGVSKGSKVLIENDGWTNKDKILFADVGDTEEKFKFALEAGLSKVLNNLLIENFDDLKKAINYLKENDLGKASFYLLQHSNLNSKTLPEKIYDYSLSRKAERIAKEEGFLGWSHEFVKCAEKWKPYFKKVLARTAVAKDIDSALRLISKYPRFTFTTLDGDLIQNDGKVEAGSSPKLDETLFGRKQHLESLIKEYPSYEANLRKLSELIEETEEKLSSIDLKVISDQGKVLLNEFNNIEKQISQLEFEKTKYSEFISETQGKINQLVAEANHTNKEIESLKALIDENTILKEKSNNKLHEIETKLKEIETEYNVALSENNRKELELERLKGSLTNTENSIIRAEENKVKTILTIERREKDIQSTEEELLTIKNLLEEYQIDYDEVYSVRQALADEEKIINTALDSLKQEAAKYEKELNNHRNERQDISDQLHEVDIKLNQLSMKVENLLNHIKEEYAIELELKAFDDLDAFNFIDNTGEVQNLKHELKSLGPINLLAYSEFEEEQERFEFLQKQRDDLVVSERDLIKTIHEINNTAQELFIDTFQKIRENFINIFRTLFDPGDEADLLLQEDVDPLEAKIEILAKPKGKRPTSIELLSGGEKTLTATALLFAIYLVKPSPFCILDEVDAPLDDANIDRFTKLLGEFSNNTQFIIVTHNKRTMNSAENMYGVTMQEEGISKLAAVQFNDSIKIES
ncbi:MAG: chromosome segregation protein SMC [Bacteroidota bacterium]